MALCPRLCPLLVGVLIALAGCRRPVGPHIEVLPPRLSLGEMPTEHLAHVEFSIRNSGSRTLELYGIDFACGCTQAKFPETVAPGDTAKIGVIFQPDLFWTGPRVQRARIRSNDPQLPQVEFEFDVNLRPPIALSPPSPQVITYRPGNPIDASVTLTPRDPNGTVRAAKANRGRREGNTFHFHFNPGVGDHEMVERFESSAGPLDYSFVLQARSGPVATPAEITVPRLRAGIAPIKLREIQIFTRQGSLDVLRVEVGNPALRSTIEKTGSTYRIALSYVGGWKIGAHQGQISVRLRDPEFPVILIPYRIEVVP